MNEEEILGLNEPEEDETEQEPKGKDGSFDPAIVKSMIATGENQEGMIQELPEDKKEPLFESQDEDAESKIGKINKKLGRYLDAFVFDMKKNPEYYMVETPEGKMRLEDAIKRGYDPATKEFSQKSPKQKFEDELAGLSDEGKQKIMALSDPAIANLPPDEGRDMGLDESNPMIRGAEQAQPMPEQSQQPGQGIDPNLLAALGGGQ
jgi:hypothetical protein